MHNEPSLSSVTVAGRYNYEGSISIDVSSIHTILNSTIKYFLTLIDYEIEWGCSQACRTQAKKKENCFTFFYLYPLLRARYSHWADIAYLSEKNYSYWTQPHCEWRGKDELGFLDFWR